MKDYPTLPINSWESTREGALKKIRNAAKDSDNEILNEIAKEEDPKAIMERQKNIEVIRRITDKCIDNYREGEYSFPETVAMICSALKKVK